MCEISFLLKNESKYYSLLCRKFCTASRVVFGRNSVQPKISSSLTERNQSLKHLFTVKTLAMKQKPKKVKEVVETKKSVKEQDRENNKQVGKGAKQRKQLENGEEKMKLVGKERLDKLGKGDLGKMRARDKSVVEKLEKGEDKANLDDKGYKTVIRPAVSTFI
mgnify:CR=1 FL=1